ncbi:GAP family protein, partial [Mycolicibacterium vaccae]
MWIPLLAMAVAVSLEPFRLGMTVLMVNRPRPALQLLALLAGGFAMGTAVGLVTLFVLRPALGSAHFTLPRVQIVVGAVVLVNAALIAVGRFGGGGGSGSRFAPLVGRA